MLIKPGSRVAVLGLGISGKSAVRYALYCGAEVLVSDSRPQQQFMEQENIFLQETGVKWEADGHSLEFLSQAELVLVSPGVDQRIPLITELRERGIRISGELEAVANQFDVPVIAVTGTNGKTTVTTLIGETLKLAGKKVFIGGNIGTPLYEYLTAKQRYDFIVVELSSFQLDYLGNFAPNIAVLLNVSPDHLDRHGSMEQYVAAKMKLFQNQKGSDVAIINGDDPNCRTPIPVSAACLISFGRGEDNDLILQESALIEVQAGARVVHDLGEQKVAGGFQTYNLGAAFLALRAAGCSVEEILAGLQNFHSPHHRLELVAEVKGIRYYDDSKATNTGAVIGALDSFHEPVILIAGGRDKGDDYSLLRESVEKKVKRLVLIGEATKLMRQALAGGTEIIEAASMADAVEKSVSVANSGDVVLLSPACASFDMFRSYSHRGEVFAEAVKNIAEAA